MHRPVSITVHGFPARRKYILSKASQSISSISITAYAAPDKSSCPFCPCSHAATYIPSCFKWYKSEGESVTNNALSFTLFLRSLLRMSSLRMLCRHKLGFENFQFSILALFLRSFLRMSIRLEYIFTHSLDLSPIFAFILSTAFCCSLPDVRKITSFSIYCPSINFSMALFTNSPISSTI